MKNRALGILIAAVTFFGPFQYAFSIDIEKSPIQMLCLVLTVIGSIAAISVGTKKTPQTA